MKISAVIIAKNAESMIADCIDSVSFCNEILVLDDLSTDKTADIAKMKGATVISHAFQNFAQKRNYGKQKAKHEWIFYIDTDEQVTDDLKKEILKTVARAPKFGENTAYAVKRENYYFGRNPWPYTEELERLFYKPALGEWHGDVHETASYKGSKGVLAGFLMHYTHRDLSSMLEKTNAWSEMEAQLRYAANHPPMSWWRFLRVMATGFYDSYIKQKGYKAGTVGLIESIFQSYSMFITYAKLWELQQKNV